MAGFNPGPIDMDFGSMTKAALEAFQEAQAFQLMADTAPNRICPLSKSGRQPTPPAQSDVSTPQQNEFSTEDRDFSTNPNPAVISALQWSLGKLGAPYLAAQALTAPDKLRAMEAPIRWPASTPMFRSSASLATIVLASS